MHAATLRVAVVSLTLRGLSGAMSKRHAARTPGMQATYPVCPIIQRITTDTPMNINPGSPKFTLLAAKAHRQTSIKIGTSTTKGITRFSRTSQHFGPRYRKLTPRIAAFSNLPYAFRAGQVLVLVRRTVVNWRNHNAHARQAI